MTTPAPLYDPIPVGQPRTINGKVYTSVVLRKKTPLPEWMPYKCAGCPAVKVLDGCGFALCGLNLSDPLRAPVIVPDHWVPLLALEGVLA